MRRESHTITAEVDESLDLAGREAELQSVVVNLLTNAAHALAKTRTPSGRIAVSVDVDGGQVEITVADNGPGIPDELQDRIFEPHFTTKGEEGTGLGLAISRRLAEENGGALSLLPSPSGAAFALRLPRVVAENAEPPPPLSV